MSQAQAQAQSQLALVKRDVVDVVADKVKEFQNRGEIHFPANYSPENALKSAWLILQNVVDRNNRPALQVCTKDSIANSLLDMVVQGLNPAKKQGYFIVYGNQLVFQRSYFGTMAVTKRVTGAKDILPMVVYEGDEFEFEIVRGKKKVTKHKQTLQSMASGKIVAAYCMIVFPDDSEFTEIMTWDEIQTAWKRSRQNPDKEGSTHKEFPQEMAKRTIINRTCKAYLNSSDDGSLLFHHINRADDAAEEAEVMEEIAQNANKEIVDVDYEVVDDKSGDAPEEPAPQEPPQSKEESASFAGGSGASGGAGDEQMTLGPDF
jgi:Recombinational DNA repair protein (RecE pathway)